MTLFETAFALLVSHALCDFTFQTEPMAKGKNRNRPPPEPPPGAKPQTIWPYWLSAHALIHGGGVALVTGIWWLGLCEAIAHAAIDFGKCENWYGINTDQAAHIACKFAWLGVAAAIAAGA